MLNCIPNCFRDKRIGSRVWHFAATWRHRSYDHLLIHKFSYAIHIGGLWNQAFISNGFQDTVFNGGCGTIVGMTLIRPLNKDQRLLIYDFLLEVGRLTEISNRYPIFSKTETDTGRKFRGVPLEQTRHVGVAKSERPRLTNGEIIFEEF